jgi:hypothetical protein
VRLVLPRDAVSIVEAGELPFDRVREAVVHGDECPDP